MYRISDEHERTPRMSRPLLTTSFCSSDHRIHTQGSSSIYIQLLLKAFKKADLLIQLHVVLLFTMFSLDLNSIGTILPVLHIV